MAINKNEKDTNNLIWGYKKINSWRKGNYINEDKTEETYKSKYYNNELETIYSESVDRRYKQLVVKWYDYILNLLKYEFDYKTNLIYLEEKIWQSIYFMLLNYILIFNLKSKSELLNNLSKMDFKRKNIYKILDILNIDIKKVNSKNILEIFNNITIKNLSQEDCDILKWLITEEIVFIRMNIDSNILNTIKERKNKVGQEISVIIFNTYDFLFLLYYITKFFDELSFILSDKNVKDIVGNFEKYNLIIEEDEFVTIIEIIVMFFLKGYKTYLYKNYNFLWAINEIVLKTKEALEYKKWSPIKSNFKSWLSNWSKNYIKKYIQEEVRPLENMEKMNFIYNQLENTLSNNHSNKSINLKEENNLPNQKNKKNDTDTDTENIDLKTLESYKQQIINNNNNNNLMDNYDEVVEYITKLNKIYEIKRGISIKKKPLNKKIDNSITKKNIIKWIKNSIYDVYDYIDKKVDSEYSWKEKLIGNILDNLEKYNKIELYSFSLEIIEVITWKMVTNYSALNKLINQK